MPNSTILRTKFNRPNLAADHLQRPHLVEILEKNRHVPLILVSAPTGYGKSILISQWLEKKGDNYGWLSLDENMDDASTFLSYFIEALNISDSVGKQRLKNLERESHFLAWQTVIEVVVNGINEFQGPFKLILDDYHLISNQDIHKLMDTIIREEIKNFQLVIITRRDPPFHLRGLRLYQKMLELRARDLRFNQDDIAKLLAMERIVSFSEDETSELLSQTEGWILAIRMIIAAKSIPGLRDKTQRSLSITSDLDNLMDHISDNLDPEFLRQMQLCALCDQFNSDLIDSIFTYAFKDSGNADVFLAKMRDFNFSLIPTSDDGTWYRFHHLIGDILRRQLERSEPTIIKPLYIKISEWFSGKGLIDEAIHYAIKAKNYELACDLISKHRMRVLEQGHWWVVQRWLDKIPRQIRNANVDILLTELLVCEETWNIEDFSSILDTLKSVGIENSNDKNISLYLFHLGYFLTFVKPDPKQALESIEQSKALLYDESYMFGGRRELVLACCRQMLGFAPLALQSLEEIQEKLGLSSKMYSRPIHGKVLVHLLSGNFKSANSDAKKLLFHVQDSALLHAKGWGLYFLGNVAFQSNNEYEAVNALNESLALEGVFNYRAYFDALAGLTLISSLKKDEKATASFLEQMSRLATKLKDTKFQLYYRSIMARINWHRGLGNKEVAWAQTDWVNHTSASYLFLMDVPELTKIRIMVSHGSVLQVEEALNVIEEVETFLANLHNEYHIIDIEFLKAMALLHIGRAEEAEVSFNKALVLAEKKDMIRPVIEAYRVMPSLFHHMEKSSYISHRVLSRIGLRSNKIKSPHVSGSKIEDLSIREEEVIQLITEGLRNKEIADQLNISPFTVKCHLTNIYRKLEVPNRTSMIRKVRDLDLLS